MLKSSPAQNRASRTYYAKNVGEIKTVRVLGSEKDIEWNQTESGLEVTLTGTESSKYGFVVEAEF